MINHDADSGIPLLTEVMPIDDEATRADDQATLYEPPLLLMKASIPERTLPSALADLQETTWTEEDFASMQAEMSDRITRQVLRRLDVMLEDRIRDSLADVLQLAVSGLAQEIRQELKQTLEEAISRAVAQEMPNFQTKNNPL
ncbi:hypothetical protein [Actimicrobium sp. CCI2.3]|uniref:hypothetical protein n=1 Tax=Actimicrobium sp. CCI2.3 TaxID=3048616 RepID=UPI002AB43FDD|nr:hypothetical protein [Actimicrobium sp. CCI2.3]MDY7573805.1 hypothetical protein [Actimicrobium sp. CCI2.3]MEB0022416.1 hypothetical protein [Actimicrobium sp. CCI2.3]